MAMLARQVMNLRTSLEQRNIHSARERIRHYLAVNLGPDGRSVPLAGTLKDLASTLGLTHEVLYRTLSQMQKDGEVAAAQGEDPPPQDLRMIRIIGEEVPAGVSVMQGYAPSATLRRDGRAVAKTARAFLNEKAH